MQIILDGREMTDEEFNERFNDIVGISLNEWIDKYKTIQNCNDGWYNYNDGTYYLNGCPYKPPVLFK